MTDPYSVISILEPVIQLFLLVFFVYIIYLIVTKAFQEMGFSSIEAILIVFASYLFHFNITVEGFNISYIYLFSYNNWDIFINIGGAVIPLLISLYLAVKKKLSASYIMLGVAAVTLVTFFVTHPDPMKGIVSVFPYWLLPAFTASIISVAVYWRDCQKAAPLAYLSGTVGVLIGADLFHLPALLSYRPEHVVDAAIGGANVFDMIFITGIIAVLIDGLLLVRRKRSVT
ncbi:MAG TPA: DUF1614 domain-containing protein [Thermoplasmatales archaeon]|nr:DUF1614 domain-containing protein [Thermoplasmatales archaeon]